MSTTLAKAFAWFGSLVFVLGTCALIYFLAADESSSYVTPSGAPGILYGALTIEPMIILASSVLWGIAALLWTRSDHNPTGSAKATTQRQPDANAPTTWFL